MPAAGQTVPLSTPHFGAGAQGIAIAVALAVSAVAWAIWQFAGARPRLWLTTLAIMGVAGGALAGLSSLSTAARSVSWSPRPRAHGCRPRRHWRSWQRRSRRS